MKIAIIGGGISGLSTAYYLKKFSLPVTEIVLYEASSRFGGWIDSKKVTLNNEDIYLEKGPRTLRLTTGELKEINSIKLANDLNLSSNIEIISKNHPASVNRYIYFNGQINVIKPKLIGKTPLMSKGLFRYLLKELRSPKRDSSVEDETIWSFISRRLDSEIAENLIDPVFKGITGGDVRNLSAAALLKTFYQYEDTFGSISKGAFNKARNPIMENYEKYHDLLELRDKYRHQSVWRFKDGMQKFTERLAEELSKYENVKLCLNDPVKSVSRKNDKMSIISKNSHQDFDMVISSVYSKINNQFLSDEYVSLKESLSKIEAVNMVVVNFVFKDDLLPFKGFGYLVPTNQKSPILGCIFDSVFNKPQEKNTCLTVMLGGAWYDEYLKNKSSDQIKKLAFTEVRKHLNIKVDPDYEDISILKEAIPQYRVGHNKLLSQIKNQIKEYGLSEKLYLTGFSYDGIGINDCIFNARKLVQDEISNSRIVKNLSR